MKIWKVQLGQVCNGAACLLDYGLRERSRVSQIVRGKPSDRVNSDIYDFLLKSALAP